jgi:uncharacterized protein (DUF2384 family)
MSPSAETIFVKIMKAWNIGDEDARKLLGAVPAESYEAMKSEESTAALTEEQLMRVSYLVGIYKALRILLNDELATTWMTRPNDNNIFGGTTPLTYCMKEGMPGLATVRRLLDAQCEGT